jgi:hypothetical protein
VTASLVSIATTLFEMDFEVSEIQRLAFNIALKIA